MRFLCSRFFWTLVILSCIATVVNAVEVSRSGDTVQVSEGELLVSLHLGAVERVSTGDGDFAIVVPIREDMKVAALASQCKAGKGLLLVIFEDTIIAKVPYGPGAKPFDEAVAKEVCKLVEKQTPRV